MPHTKLGLLLNFDSIWTLGYKVSFVFFTNEIPNISLIADNWLDSEIKFMDFGIDLRCFLKKLWSRTRNFSLSSLGCSDLSPCPYRTEFVPFYTASTTFLYRFLLIKHTEPLILPFRYFVFGRESHRIKIHLFILEDRANRTATIYITKIRNVTF